MLQRCQISHIDVLVRLINLAIERNYFPPSMKENLIIPIYKRIDPTDPNNYKSIVLANTLQILISLWFSQQLSTYVWTTGLVPETQTAGRSIYK